MTMNTPPLMPSEMKRTARFLWGGQWRVALGRIVRMRPADLERIEASADPVPAIIADALVVELDARANGCRERADAILGR